jgi:hypothetical protein
VELPRNAVAGDGVSRVDAALEADRYAPNDADQGFIQKRVALHVPLAIVALGGFVGERESIEIVADSVAVPRRAPTTRRRGSGNGFAPHSDVPDRTTRRSRWRARQRAIFPESERKCGVSAP